MKDNDECKYDFDYSKCLNFLDCQFRLVCWDLCQMKKGMIKKNDVFKKLIGNYELFD